MKSAFSFLPLLTALLILAVPDAGAQCPTQLLGPAQPGALGRFGFEVQIEGTRMAISSARGDATGPVGYVDVYEWNGTDWLPDAVLHVPYSGGVQGAPLTAGLALDMDGDRLVFSIPTYGANDWGAICIYEKSQGQWAQAAFIENPVQAANGSFGSEVAIEGDLVLVGAERFNGRTGIVYAYERNASGTWVQTFTLSDSQGGFNQYFGRDLDLEGDRLAVVGGGEVILFQRSQGVWAEAHRLQDSAQSVGFFEVELEGDLLATGTWLGCPDGGTCGPGWGYVFRFDGTSWNLGEQLVSPNPLYFDAFFGSEIAIDAGRVLIGAQGSTDIYDTYDHGGGYLYEDRGQGFELTQIFRPPVEGIQYGSGAVLELHGDLLAMGLPLDSTFGGALGSLALFQVVDGVQSVCRGTQCPCGNDNAKVGCANSITAYPTYRAGAMDACGTTSVSADDLVLRASGLPENSFGLMVMGHLGGGMPVILGDGLLCLDQAQGLYRFPTRPTGTTGAVEEGPGLAAYSASSLPVAATIQAGSSFTFQFWYRDASGPCQAGYTITNGARVLFRP